MSILSDLLVGKSEQTSQSGTENQFQKRAPSPQTQQMYDMLSRAFVGQMVNPPNTAISVPTQQALSSLQGMSPAMQGAGGPLVNRLSAPASTPTDGSGGTSSSFLPGANQGGLQTREQMGLPDRKSYFTFMPSAQQVADIGLAPIRPGGQKNVQQAFKDQQAAQARIAQRTKQGKPYGQATKKLQQAQDTLQAYRGPSYLPGT